MSKNATFDIIFPFSNFVCIALIYKNLTQVIPFQAVKAISCCQCLSVLGTPNLVNLKQPDQAVDSYQLSR